MKILCTAVVALSLVSVCQPASLACNNLLTPVEKNQELVGRWHLIASDSELFPAITLFNTLLWPSLALDVTSTDKRNIYDFNLKAGLYGYCFNATDSYFYENSKFWDVDSDNSPTGVSDVLLQTSCSDCIVVKSEVTIGTLLLLSRRKSISETELKEFEIQAQCLGRSTVKMNTELDFDNCKIFNEDMSPEDAKTLVLNILSNILSKMSERISNTFYKMYYCIKNKLQSYFLQSINDWYNLAGLHPST